MKTLGYLVETRNTDSLNNFTLLRAMAATLVVYGHSFVLAPKACPTCLELVRDTTHYAAAHVVGVQVFFAISGFLVTASYLRGRSIGDYLLSRLLRILPGLLVCLGLTLILVGPLFTNLSLHDYLTSEQTLRYFLINSSLYNTAFELPGVHFTSAQDGNTVNGSLWTLPLEARLYLLIALAGMVGILRSRVATNTLILCGMTFLAAYPQRLPLTGPHSASISLSVFFVAGVCFFINRQSIPIDWRVLGIMFLAACFSYWLSSVSFKFLGALSLAYAIFFIAYAPKLNTPAWLGDYSYGIYLYGFPIQQMTAHLLPEIGPYKLMAISIPAAWLAGALSWHLVEKPFLNLRRKLSSVIRA